MAKILVMTDLHITPEGQSIIGLDPGQRLADGLAHAARVHPDADRLVLMGDLTHHGADYMVGWVGPWRWVWFYDRTVLR